MSPPPALCTSGPTVLLDAEHGVQRVAEQVTGCGAGTLGAGLRGTRAQDPPSLAHSSLNSSPNLLSGSAGPGPTPELGRVK